jgi:hypothetical protein
MSLSPAGGRRMEIRRPAFGTKHIPAFGSSEGTKRCYFGCSFNAAELMQ